MKCSKCSEEIQPGAERSHFDTILCEYCYIPALSPVKTRGTWAIDSTEMPKKKSTKTQELTSSQIKLLQILKCNDSIEYEMLLKKVNNEEVFL